jgi:hypothetical protein
LRHSVSSSSYWNSLRPASSCAMSIRPVFGSYELIALCQYQSDRHHAVVAVSIHQALHHVRYALRTFQPVGSLRLRRTYDISAIRISPSVSSTRSQNSFTTRESATRPAIAPPG